MAKGDRVIVGDGYHWAEEDKQKTMAYMPVLNERQQVQETPDGGVIVEAVGGVVCGSRGIIDGPVMRVHRSYVHDARKTGASFNSTDFVEMVPVFLEKYQRVGYFQVDHIRIYGTAV